MSNGADRIGSLRLAILSLAIISVTFAIPPECRSQAPAAAAVGQTSQESTKSTGHLSAGKATGPASANGTLNLRAYQAAQAEVSTDYLKAERLSQQILARELEVVALSSFLWREYLTETEPWYWRRVFYRAFGSGVATAAYIIDTWADFRDWRTPQLKPRYANLAASTMRFIGKNEVAAGVTFERSLAALKAKRAKAEGLDLSTTDGIAEKTASRLSELLRRRNRIISSSSTLSDNERRALDAETAVLADGRDQALFEYATVHVRVVQKTFAQAGVDYLRIFRRADGAYLGNLPDMIREVLVSELPKAEAAGASIGTTVKEPSYIGLSRAGSLGTLTSGSMGVINPIVVYFATRVVRRESQKAIDRRLGEPSAQSLDRFADDTAAYSRSISKLREALPAVAGQIAGDNLNTYRLTGKIIDQVTRITRDERRATTRREFHVQSVRFFAGSTKVFRGVLKVVRDWDSRYYPAGRRDLISGYAALVRLPGTGLLFADSLFGIGYEFCWHKHLAERRIAPSLVLADRLESIEKMQMEIEHNIKELDSLKRARDIRP